MKKILAFKDEYRFLSNFWPCDVYYKMVKYPSVENAYQASKTLILAERERFKTATPGQAKKLGRQLEIHGYLRNDWDDVKVSIMRGLLQQKFENSKLKELLLKTGDTYLEEGNTWGDKFWGVYQGQGENTLGKLLMEIREKIKKEIQPI